MRARPINPVGCEPRAVDAESRRFSQQLVAVFVCLAGGIILAGYLYLSNRQSEARAEAFRELNAIADLKLRQLSNWRKERISDALFFSRARFVAEDIQRYFNAPDSEAARSGVLHWLDLLKAGDRYDTVALLDGSLQPRLVLPASAGGALNVDRHWLESAVQNRAPTFGDLHLDEASGSVRMDLVFPVFEGADEAQKGLVGAILLRLDPRQFLFPLIESWPVPSQTAETLLVRREGDEVVYLNDLRNRPGTALKLRLPITSRELPAARVLAGESGIMEGVDYRGMRVVATGREVSETSWAMVAKVDRDEIYAPLRQQAFTVVSVLGALLLAGALLVALLWRQHSAQFLERELAERKAHQYELAQANASLEQKVAERTAQLVEANQNLQAFAHTAAHDLRSPLRSIGSFSSILAEEYGARLGADGLSLLNRTVASAEQMKRLLEDLLEYSKISQSELDLRPIGLGQALREALELLETEIGTKHASVNVIDPLPSIIGHPSTVVLILNNLISNALKFMPPDREPRIRIRAEVAEHGAGAITGSVRLWIEDNGIGIAPEHQERIFGAFQRLHGKSAYPGTGLGLAIVRKGAERMGGHAGVISAPGQGSRFWVEFREAASTTE
jgi:signal transduction histidine kinase